MNICKSLLNFIVHRANTLFVKTYPSFVDDFIRNVLYDKYLYPEYEVIERVKLLLQSNSDLIISNNLGAGTRSGHKTRTIGSMAKVASVGTKYGQLLFRISRYFKPVQIIELGTAFGISSMYMAFGNSEARIITVEGNAQLVKTAANGFNEAGLKNITIINSQFDIVLPQLVSSIRDNAMIFIDGNHTYEATVRYFNSFKDIPCNSIIMIFDDINWSNDMMLAWKKIKNSSNTGLIIDLYHMGIIFKIAGLSEQYLQIFY